MAAPQPLPDLSAADELRQLLESLAPLVLQQGTSNEALVKANDSHAQRQPKPATQPSDVNICGVWGDVCR